MEEDLAIFFAPDEAPGKAPPQFAARRLVANAAQQAGAQYMQFGLALCALEAEQQPVPRSSDPCEGDQPFCL